MEGYPDIKQARKATGAAMIFTTVLYHIVAWI
jgi:hypothetical protein